MSLVERLRANVDAEPDRVALTFQDATLSRQDWDSRARAVAERLKPGTRVIVLSPAGLDYFVSVAAALYAGACAVPLSPRNAAAKLADLVVDAEAAAVLTTSAHALLGERLRAERGVPAVEWIEVDTITTGTSWTPPAIAPDDLALLHYTSGSTGAPKGVAVSRGSLDAWLDGLAQRLALPAGSSVVSWAPVHTALGLTMVLMATPFEGTATILAPEDVLADPRHWLASVSAATGPVFSGAPPFMYQQCVEQVPARQREGLDLSGWEVALIGSERIRTQVLDRFTEAYRPYGFKSTAFFPSYGMTEIMMGAGHRGGEAIRVTVDAAQLELGRVAVDSGAERVIELVGCGPPAGNANLVIVDPQTRIPCVHGEVGELWIEGPIVASGYWRRKEQTERTFHNRLADGTGSYLRTGDLAFFHEGELVVCGRLSELVIIRGRNLLPQDVEATVQSCDPVMAGRPIAAFSVEQDSGEQLIVLATVDTAPAGLAARIRTAVTAAHEVEPHRVYLLAPGSIPLTDSGKVQRGACRRAYLAGTLRPIATAEAHAPVAPAEDAGVPRRLSALLAAVPEQIRHTVAAAELRIRIGELLGRPADEIQLEDEPLAGLGLDSMNLIKLRATLVTELGLTLPLEDLSKHTVAELATTVLDLSQAN